MRHFPVLIIEDDPSIAENILYFLKKEELNPVWCATGGEALDKIGEVLPRIIILDVGLPDINGFELFKKIQKIRETPVIFLTARSEEIDRVVGLELGADDYLVKPFSLRELLARIKAVLRRKEKDEAPLRGNNKKTSESFIIDEIRKKILFKDKPLDLSRNEYLLLKLLAENPGRVYSRDELLERALADDGLRLDRTVDAHIKNIRQKIRAVDSASDPIQTHRGLGYSLKEE